MQLLTPLGPLGADPYRFEQKKCPNRLCDKKRVRRGPSVFIWDWDLNLNLGRKELAISHHVPVEKVWG